jgi:hypothetical protein
VITLLGRSVLLGLLVLAAAVSAILPAQAVSKMEPPWKLVCYEVVGRDPNGVSHDVFLSHTWSARKLAAAWVAEGWTGVHVNLC